MAKTSSATSEPLFFIASYSASKEIGLYTD